MRPPRQRLAHLLLPIAAALAVQAARITPAAAYYNRDWSATFNYEYAPTLHSGLSSCDDCNAVITLPFAFPFYGKTYSTITVSTNGMLRLGSFTDNASTTAYNKKLSYDGLPTYNYPLIAPLWDDWDTLLGGSVYTGRVGATGPFVIEWYQVKHHSQTAGGGYTFEVKLFPNGTIEFHYGAMVNGQVFDKGGDASIGYQEGGNTVGLPYAYKNANAVQPSSAIRWGHPGRVAFYAKVVDGVRPVPWPRSNLRISLGIHCNGDHPNTWSYIPLTTNGWGTEGWTFMPQPSGCPSTTGMTVEASPPYALDGYDLAALALEPNIRQVTSGLYHYYVRSDLTPAPTAAVRWNIEVGSGTWTSKLDWWASGVIDKPILVITGFDPLNEDSTADYLALLTPLVRPLLAEGYDVAIGKFAMGDRPVADFRTETALYIFDAYVRAGNRKIQVAGVSMGGIVLRHTLATFSMFFGAQAVDYVSAWYSVDAPQKGANLGRGSRGLQTLVACNKGAGDPDFTKLFSRPSKDMNFRYVDLSGSPPWGGNVLSTVPQKCACDDEPENSTCTSTTAFHDAYYNGVGWPSDAIPRHAMAFGDGVGTWSAPGSGVLYDFYYGFTCTDDGDWNGGARDMMSGSQYLDGAMVNQSVYHWYCATSGVRLKYNPGFINVDSALAATLTPEVDADSTAFPNSTVSVTRWTGGQCPLPSATSPAVANCGWIANDHNSHHKIVSEPIVLQALAWIRSHP